MVVTSEALEVGRSSVHWKPEWMKKRSEETQTLLSGCSKAEPKKISPRRTVFVPGARDGQNLISWRWSLPLPTNPVWWGSMHAISSYRGNRPTNTATNPHTDWTDYNTLRRKCSVIIEFIRHVSYGRNFRGFGVWRQVGAVFTESLSGWKVLSLDLRTDRKVWARWTVESAAGCTWA